MQIGEHTYGAQEIERRGLHNNIIIGKYCSIAKGVVMDGGFTHNPKFISTYPFKAMKQWTDSEIYLNKGDIIIGNDVWIGEDAMIMGGVTIGDGAIIAARAVVTRDVAPYCIKGGMPARTIRWRYNDETIKKLLAIKWWDWPDEMVAENADLLNSEDIDTFLDLHI